MDGNETTMTIDAAQARYRKTRLVGFAIGAASSVVLTLAVVHLGEGSVRGLPPALEPLMILVLPGMIAYFVAYCLCAGELLMPFFSGPHSLPGHLAWIPMVAFHVANMIVSGCIGAFIGAAWAKCRNPNIFPTCRFCEFEWKVPTEPACPNCHATQGFAEWMNKPLPDSQCAHCGFNLRDGRAKTCPKCGGPVDQSASSAAQSARIARAHRRKV